MNSQNDYIGFGQFSILIWISFKNRNQIINQTVRLNLILWTKENSKQICLAVFKCEKYVKSQLFFSFFFFDWSRCEFFCFSSLSPGAVLGPLVVLSLVDCPLKFWKFFTQKACFWTWISTGTFAQDAFRRIRDEEHENLDCIIRIHENLCTVVFNTVSAYSVWFVLHWFTYGIGVVLSVIYISKELLSRSKYCTPTINLVYLGLFFLCHLYLFLLPCMFAANITSRCTGKKGFLRFYRARNRSHRKK